MPLEGVEAAVRTICPTHVLPHALHPAQRSPGHQIRLPEQHLVAQLSYSGRAGLERPR